MTGKNAKARVDPRVSPNTVEKIIKTPAASFSCASTNCGPSAIAIAINAVINTSNSGLDKFYLRRNR
jgi:hypothetical protein